MNHAMAFIDTLFEAPAPAPARPDTRPTTIPGPAPAPPAPGKPRPGTRPWSPRRRPGTAPRPKAVDDEDTDDYIEPRPKACAGSYGETLGSVSVPPPPSDDESGPEPVTMSSAVALIRPGDRVHIVSPQGSRLSGRAVMRGKDGSSWTLNMGGRHGTPGVASDENIVKVTRGGKTIYGRM